MVNDETKRKLRELTLDGFIDALSIQNENPALFTVMLFDERKENKAIIFPIKSLQPVATLVTE